MSAQSLQTEGKLRERNNEKICPPDTAAMEQCQQRWDSIAKPLHSLGRLEEVLIQTAGMTGSDEVHFGKKSAYCHVCRQWGRGGRNFSDRAGSHCGCSGKIS